MKLSSGERLTLLMLCDVFQALDIKNSFDPDFVRDAVLGGHHWALGWEYAALSEDPVDDSVVGETGDIMTMWRVIEQHYDSLSDVDKSKVNLANHDHAPQFEGFDGNNDRHYSVAKFLVQKMNRFDEFSNRSLNSHSTASLPKYLKMLPVYQAKIASLTDTLSANEIIDILNA